MGTKDRNPLVNMLCPVSPGQTGASGFQPKACVYSQRVFRRIFFPHLLQYIVPSFTSAPHLGHESTGDSTPLISAFEPLAYSHLKAVRKEATPVHMMKTVYPTMKRAGKYSSCPTVIKATPRIKPIIAIFLRRLVCSIFRANSSLFFLINLVASCISG